MAEPVVATEIRDGVLLITIGRPPANALGVPLIEGLAAAVHELESGPAKAAVVCSSLDGFFVAGADIKHMAELSPEEFAAYGVALRAPMNRLAGARKPSIAAIDGLALGGGMELAMACSLRFATAGSSFGLPEVKLGLIPGAGGTQRLPRLVGRGRALELTLSGRQIGAAEAARIGLVDRLVADDVLSEALEFAARLAGFSAEALGALLECADAAEGDSDRGMEIEAAAVARTFADGEAREGITAFVEKRRPTFA